MVTGRVNKKRIIILSSCICVTLAIITIIYILYRFNVIPHKSYTDADFYITTYHSQIDQDQDGIDDQTDFLQSVRAYIATNPKYKSKYYASGYPDDEYGVCTDVVAFGLKGTGYDLMELVDTDIRNNKEIYNDSKPDKKINVITKESLLSYTMQTQSSFGMKRMSWRIGER